MLYVMDVMLVIYLMNENDGLMDARSNVIHNLITFY